MEGKTKKCPHCMQEVDAKASRCPHCHGKIYRWTIGRKVVAGLILLFLIIGIVNVFSSDSTSSPSTTSTASKSAVTQEQKDAAGKELNALFKTLGDAGLLYKWDFSESGNTLYVNRAWYDQPVDFKKDTLAKIAQLKQIATGYRHYEVRDATSNEKVAEVTAFSGSIEVYR